MLFRFPLLSLFVAAGLAAADHAQLQVISGDVFDGSGGPLVWGVTYHVDGGITVPQGETLTIQAGAILKVDGGTVGVDGTLVGLGGPQGTIFTSATDDTVGVDLTAGPSAASPGDWGGIRFRPGSSASSLTDATVRFAGAGVSTLAAISFTQSDATLSGVTVDACSKPGLHLGSSSFPTVTGSGFTNNGGVAVTHAPTGAVAGFSGCTASGNAGGDYLLLGVPGFDGTFAGDLAITTDNTLNGSGVIVSNVNLEVAAGQTLTLGPGVTFKMEPLRSVTVFGTLKAEGSEGSPVVFTSLADDAFGGDTNQDGAGSAGVPGSWGPVQFQPGSGASELRHTRIRFGGPSGSSVALSQSDLLLDSCLIENGASDGLSLGGNSRPTVTGCSFDGHAGIAVDGVGIDALPGFSGCTAGGNAGGDYQRVGDGTFSGALALDASMSLDGSGVFVLTNQVSIDAGESLTLGAGLVFKWASPAFDGVFADGPLFCNGTAGSPVVFTSLADDAFGGDTNGDGPSVGSPGAWSKVLLRSGASASVLDFLHVRFAGRLSSGGAVELDSCHATLNDVRVENASIGGFSLPSSFPVMERCAVNDTAGVAYDNVRLDALPGLRHNTASGNAGGDHLEVASSTIGGTVRVSTFNYPGDAFVSQSLTVDAGARLVLERGVVVKMRPQRGITVLGALDALGTGLEPVVVTSLTDDVFGGDTNGDGGASVGVPGSWTTVFLGGSAPSLLEHLVVRFAGQFGGPSLNVDTSGATLRSVRVDHGLNDGIRAKGHAGPVAANWTAFDCGGDGIELTGDAFDLVHATSVGNLGRGILRLGGHTGRYENCISFSNAAGNFGGIAAADVSGSNGDAGFAGSDGNIFADPMFVDEAEGDLRLSAGSPCVDTALPTTELEDAFESPRALDDDLDGLLEPDMGAFERARFTLAVTGQPQLGTTLQLRAEGGEPGIAAYALGDLGGTLVMPPFGIVLAGNFATLFLLGTGAVGVDFPFALPAPTPALEGFEGGLQAIAFDFSGVGSLTNLYRAKLFN